ncbi:hypothetical protein [Pumilibacter muris]|uniref:hypothetical protein n=1 Tax=Pumilibacter muris TaxID=2941510 RepID=UPI00203D3FD7|nr:hypothetical protein [Pumilibacter muris]
MIRRIITAVIAFILGATCAVGGFFVYRKVKPTGKEFATHTAQSLLTDASKNPYENPDDPNTTSSGTCFSTDVMTGYFMEVKLSNQSTGIINPDYEKNWGDWSGTAVWSDKTHDATALLTFVDIKYNNQPVFVSVFTKVRYERKSIFHAARLWSQEDFTEENGKAIRIPKSYYNFMQYALLNQGASLRRFNLTFIKNSGKDVMPLKYTQEVDVRLFTKDIPADSDDPTSPDFKLDNWAGIMSAMKNGKGCAFDSIPDWLWGIIVFLGVILAIRLLVLFFAKK